MVNRKLIMNMFFQTFHSTVPINWILGFPPPSEPECGFDGTLCQFEPSWPTAVICVVVIAAAAVATVFACR